jgi:hypothetical protein
VGTSQTEILDTGPRTTGVIGGQHYFNGKLNLTANYRFRKTRDNFDTFFNNDNGITISRFNFTTHEFNTRLTWKPVKWFQNSVRVQLGDTVYRIRNLGNFTNSPDWHKSQANAQTYTYNAVFQPRHNWLFDLAYSLNNARVSTPATQYDTASGGIPTFLANVHSLIFTASYIPRENLSVFSSAYYSLAKNYDDKSFAGIPYGVDNNHYDVSLGLEWTPKEDMAIKPRYAYYSYETDPSIDYSNYSAHAGWLEFSYNW